MIQSSGKNRLVIHDCPEGPAGPTGVIAPGDGDTDGAG
jgi:hypothetical protein